MPLEISSSVVTSHARFGPLRHRPPPFLVHDLDSYVVLKAKNSDFQPCPTLAIDGTTLDGTSLIYERILDYIGVSANGDQLTYKNIEALKELRTHEALVDQVNFAGLKTHTGIPLIHWGCALFITVKAITLMKALSIGFLSRILDVPVSLSASSGPCSSGSRSSRVPLAVWGS